jgi:hypothetical protein
VRHEPDYIDSTIATIRQHDPKRSQSPWPGWANALADTVEDLRGEVAVAAGREAEWVNALDLHKQRIRQLQEALCECPHRDLFQADLHDETCPVYVVTRPPDQPSADDEGKPPNRGSV